MHSESQPLTSQSQLYSNHSEISKHGEWCEVFTVIYFTAFHRLTSAGVVLFVSFRVVPDLQIATVVPECDLMSVVPTSVSSTTTGAGLLGRSPAACEATAATRPDDVFDADPWAATHNPSESTHMTPVTDGWDITSSISFFSAFSMTLSKWMNKQSSK